MELTRYQAREHYVHRKVADNDVLISIGANVANFNGFISLNPTASFLWDTLAQPRTVIELVQALTDEFDVTQQSAQADVCWAYVNNKQPFYYIRLRKAIRHRRWLQR